MKRLIALVGLVVILAGCGGGGTDEVSDARMQVPPANCTSDNATCH